MTIEITRKQVGELLKVDERSITRYQNREAEALPVLSRGKRGTPNTYCAVAVHEWDIRRKLADLTVGDDGKVYDLDSERSRLTHHQANKTALEEDVLRGKLIPSEVVEQVQGDMVSSFRARILSIPTKAAHAVLGLDDMNEAKEILKQFLYEALDELADYKPGQYGVESVGQNSNDSKTTT